MDFILLTWQLYELELDEGAARTVSASWGFKRGRMELLIAAVSFLMPKLMEPSCFDCSVGWIVPEQPEGSKLHRARRSKTFIDFTELLGCVYVNISADRKTNLVKLVLWKSTDGLVRTRGTSSEVGFSKQRAKMSYILIKQSDTLEERWVWNYLPDHLMQ